MGKDDDQIHLLAKDKSEQRTYVSVQIRFAFFFFRCFQCVQFWSHLGICVVEIVRKLFHNFVEKKFIKKQTKAKPYGERAKCSSKKMLCSAQFCGFIRRRSINRLQLCESTVLNYLCPHQDIHISILR